uniref:CRC domain-containing protein n=1 Tax=Steinernema glaseri TaxID=37863 RepID=A0A1I7ZJE5_9BILA
MAERGGEPAEQRIPRHAGLMQYVDPTDEPFDGVVNVDDDVYFDEAAERTAYRSQLAAKRGAGPFPSPVYNPEPVYQQPAQGSQVRRVVVPRQAQPQPVAPPAESSYNKPKQVFRINRATGEAVAMRAWSGVMRQPARDTRLMETQNTLYRGQAVPYSPYAQSTSSSTYSGDDYTSDVMELVPSTYSGDDYTSDVMELVPSRSFTPACIPPPKSQPKKKLPAGARKPCNCNKSMCLKLYCDCFANGEFCRDCNCKDCHNNLDHEAERTRAIKASLERNPNAFKPKIGLLTKGKSDVERLHQKGCHCKKSNCLKNYCECFEAKVPCTDRCKCTSCRNTESDRASRQQEQKQTVQNQASTSQTPAPMVKSLLNGFHVSDEENDASAEAQADPKSFPWFYLTDEVVEATALCLIARLEEAEGKAEPVELECFVLKEFARCLEQIIDNAASHVKKEGDGLKLLPVPLPGSLPPVMPMATVKQEEEEDDEDIKVEVER